MAGNVVGSWIAYWIGLYGGRPFIDRWGKYVLLRHHHLELAERWFDRWGAPTVFFSRMLPIVRTFISLPAGMGRMPFWKFTVYTLLGCIPWVIFLTWLGVRGGRQLGGDREAAQMARLRRRGRGRRRDRVARGQAGAARAGDGGSVSPARKETR